VGENKEQGRVKISRVLLIIAELPSQPISRIIEGMDLINPKRFSVEAIESQCKSQEETKGED
jgi:hypothetical protein